MPDGSPGGIELLVHATAPSRGQDDARYRAFAEAYVAFEPHKRHSLFQRDEADELSSNADRDAEIQLQDELLQSSSADNPERRETNQLTNDHDGDSYSLSESPTQPQFRRTYLTRSILAQAATLVSPKASFNSILDNADSPVFRGLGSTVNDWSEGRPVDANFTADEASWHTPQSIVADSQSPYNRAIPEFSSPTRILELYLQQLGNSNLESTSEVIDPPTSARGPSSRFPASSTPKDNSILAEDPGSRIPVSPAPPVALTPPTAELRERLFEEPLEIIHSSPPVIHAHHTGLVTASSPPHATASSETSLTHTRSQSDPLHLRAHHSASNLSSQNCLPPTTSDTLTNPTTTRKRNHSPAPPSSSSLLLSSSAREVSSAPLPRLPPPKKPRFSRHGANEIHPPLPPTSVLPLSSSLTPALLSLAAGLTLSKRYQPTLETRSLRQLERGYWLIAVSSWPIPLRVRAWEFLQGYIGNGLAGWGVWCCRSAIEGWADLGGKEGQDEAGGEEWRVYCWGEAVGHIYLLLYLASERLIKGAGAKWVDGAGEVVVSMPVGRVRTL